MQVRIKRIDPTLPLPAYQTAGSVALDLYARETTTVAPQQIGLIPTNIIVQTPEHYMLIVVPRSSTPKRKGLLIPHGIGIIDQDYCGANDEVLLQVMNFTDTAVTVERGDRIGQAVFVSIAKVELEEGTIEAKTRGRVGSTGTHISVP